MTRLILIEGAVATQYDDKQDGPCWETEGAASPLDADHIQGLFAVVFDAEWRQAMADCGRRFETKRLDEIFF